MDYLNNDNTSCLPSYLVLGAINNDHTSHLSSYLVAGGLPQLLGGFGGGVSASSVSVPRVGMGGGAPLSAGNRLSGISVMLTVMGRTPVVWKYALCMNNK